MTYGEIGSIIREVIHFKTLRGKFSSVHPELKREGIVEIKIGQEGLHFVRDRGEDISYVRKHPPKLQHCNSWLAFKAMKVALQVVTADFYLGRLQDVRHQKMRRGC